MSIAEVLRSIVAPQSFWLRTLAYLYVSNVAVAVFFSLAGGIGGVFGFFISILVSALAVATVVSLALSRIIYLEQYIMHIVVIAIYTGLGFYSSVPVAYIALSLGTIVASFRLSPFFRSTALQVTAFRYMSKLYTVSRDVVKLPTSFEELVDRVKVSVLLSVSMGVSILFFLLTGYVAMIPILIYNTVAILFFVVGIYVSPNVKRQGVSFKSLFVDTVMKYSRLITLTDRLAERYGRLFDQAGVLVDRFSYVARYIGVLVQYLMIAPGIASMIMGTLFIVGYSDLAILSPLAVFSVAGLIYFLPVIDLKIKISSRRSVGERTFPVLLAFFVIYLNAGIIDFKRIFMDFIDPRSLYSRFIKQFTNEARYIVNIATFRKKTDIDAIEFYSETHPSRTVSSFFRDLINSIRHGISLKEFSLKAIETTLEDYRKSKEIQASTLSAVVEMVITSVIILLTVVSIVIFLNPEALRALLLVFALGVLPTIPLLIYAIASGIQVRFPNVYPQINIGVVALATTIGAIASYFIYGDRLTYAFTFTLAVSSGVAFIEFRRRARTVIDFEKTVPKFLFHLKDLVKVLSLNRALQEIAKPETGGYSREFKMAIERLAQARNRGLGYDQVDFVSGSWLFRFTQLLLAKIEESGVDVEEVLRIIENFFRKYIEIVSRINTSLRLAIGLSLATPLITAMIVGILSSMVLKIPTLEELAIPPSVGAVGGLDLLVNIRRAVDPLTTLLFDIIIIESALFLTLAVTKVLFGTFKNTVLIFMGSTIALLSLYIKDMVPILLNL